VYETPTKRCCTSRADFGYVVDRHALHGRYIHAKHSIICGKGSILLCWCRQSSLLHCLYCRLLANDPVCPFDNVTTVEHANVCYHEIKDAPSQQKSLCKLASQVNHRDVLKYLLVAGCTWDGEMATAAAQAGPFELLQWLVRKRGPVNATTFAAAATHSNLAMLQWLYVLPRTAGDDCPWDTTTCSTAAMHGHWNVLKWLRTKGCPWGPETCSNAALNGHLHVLLWAHSNGCPWDRTDVLGVRILALWPQ
jgi:hypothetical protein